MNNSREPGLAQSILSFGGVVCIVIVGLLWFEGNLHSLLIIGLVWVGINAATIGFRFDEILSAMISGIEKGLSAIFINYEHCLQTATLLHRDGYDDESIVTGLLHDVGYIVCPEEHGPFAANLLRSVVSEKQTWMLEHHEIFQRIHLHEYADANDQEFIHERDQWRGHPYFEWTETFVEKYDIVAIDPNFENLPIEFFEPIVQRVFASACETPLSPQPARSL